LSVTYFNVELQHFFAWFRVARVCQRQLGFLVTRGYEPPVWVEEVVMGLKMGTLSSPVVTSYIDSPQ